MHQDTGPDNTDSVFLLVEVILVWTINVPYNIYDCTTAYLS